MGVGNWKLPVPDRIVLALIVIAVVLLGMTGVGVAADGVDVGVTVSTPGETFPSDDVANIWVGVSDTSGEQNTALSGETLEVTVTDPNGDTETFTVTSGGNGSARISYDLAGRPDGSYSLEVEHAASGTTATESFDVGPSLQVTTNTFRDRPIFVGEQTTVGFVARSGDSPESGLSVDLTVTRDGTEVASETTTTDANGFATITFTPSTSGDYEVSAEATVDGRTISDSETFPTTPVAVESDFFAMDEAAAGSDATYAAFLRTPNGPLSSTDVSVQFTDSDTDEMVVDRTVTTGPNGFLVFDYQAPTDTDELEVTMQTESGESIALGTFEDNIDIESESEDEGLSLSASLSYSSPPGESTTIDIEATDSGAPIANAQVEIFLRYGFNGAPAFSGTVVTDSDGTASVPVEIPSDAPTGASLDGSAVLEYQNQTVESSLFGQVQQYDITAEAGTLERGQQAEITLSASDAVTGDPVAGIPAQFDIQYSGGLTGSFATGGLTTDSSGEASTSITVPEDIAFIQAANYVHRNTETSTFSIPRADYPGTVTVGQNTVSPGETVTVSLDVPGSTSATGIAYGHTDSPVPFAVPIETGQSAILSIPESATEGSLRIEMWGADGSGELYEGSTTVTVDDDGSDPGGENQSPDAQLTVQNTDPGVGQSVTFDASDSLDSDGQISEYRWDFDGDGATDRTTTTSSVDHAYDDAGTYDATVTVVDDDGATDSESVTVTVEDDTDGGLSATRDIASPTVPAGESTEVTVSIGAPATTSDLRFTESFGSSLSASVVDDDGATISATASGEVTASWGGVSEATITYELTIPENASDGTTYNLSGTVEDGDAGTEVSIAGDSTIEVGEPENPVAQYANAQGVVDAPGLLDAAADFRNGEIGAGTLLDVAAAFRSGEPVT